MTTSAFRSSLAQAMNDLVAFKRMEGFDYTGQAKFLEHFDTFLRGQGYCRTSLNRQIVDDYVGYTAKQAPNGRYSRLSTVRVLSHYLHQLDPESYVLQEIPVKRPSLPRWYLYSREDIAALLSYAKTLGPAGSLRPQGFHTLVGLLHLYEETATAIQHYLKLREQAGIEGKALFVNARGQRITRFGIGYLVSKHVAQAARKSPSLRNKKLTPHCYRHTTALHLIQSGVDISVVKEWLGHADLNTTSLYVDIDIDMKCKALEACPPPASPQTNEPDKPLWHNPQLLRFLQGLSRQAGRYVEPSRANR